MNYSTCSTAEDICQASAKLITFIDLAGHQKYQKTTVFGLTAGRPDLAMLVVGANSGVGECSGVHTSTLIKLLLICPVVLVWGCSSVVERLSRTQEAPGSNPGISIILLFFFLFFCQLPQLVNILDFALLLKYQHLWW